MSASSANDNGRRPLTRQQLYEFRLMARYPEVVEEVIAASSDDSPPSRAKVLRAIRSRRGLEERALSAEALHRTIDRLVAEHGRGAVLRALHRHGSPPPTPPEEAP